MGQPCRTLLPLRVALPLLALAALAGGCGDSGTRSTSSEETTSTSPPGASARSCAGAVRGIASLRVVGVGCATGRGVAASWSNRRGCAAPAGHSRSVCSAGGYRCTGTATDRGIAVSCAGPGRSISFTATRG